MNEDKFLCYGTFENKFKCLIKCPFKIECERKLQIDKMKKEVDKQNGKNNKG